MKKTKNKLFTILIAGLLILASTGCSSEKHINSAYSQEEIAQAISNNRWVFSASTASPSYGNFRQLTGGYFAKCLKDTLIVALPYFGKLNSPAGAFEGNPLDFKSTNFTLTKEDKKGGGWVVTVNRPDQEVQSMTFTFFDNGSAQLNVVMTNRTGISFSGNVAMAK